ncbi:MAG: carbamoyl phosphate synthase large subunit, partial [Candidatus Fonsibacter sp.]
MSIGANFKESVQKALCSLEIGLDGFDQYEAIDLQDLKKKLIERTPQKILYVAEAFRRDLRLDEIYEMTKIDKWFLEQIQQLIIVENNIKDEDVLNNKEKLQYIKSIGFSDKKIAKILKIKSNEVRSARNKFKIHPIYKKIDTCAGEFDSKTPYMYSTYASNDLSG